MGYWKYLITQLRSINYNKLIFNIEVIIYIGLVATIGVGFILILSAFVHPAFLVLIVPFAVTFGYFITYLRDTYYTNSED